MPERCSGPKSRLCPERVGAARQEFMASQFKRTHAERQTNAMNHEPCRLLRYADCAMNFVVADAILAVHYLPHASKPLVHASRGVFNNRASLERELTARMTAPTLPAVVLLHNLAFATAARPNNTIRPTKGNNVFTAVRRIG